MGLAHFKSRTPILLTLFTYSFRLPVFSLFLPSLRIGCGVSECALTERFHSSQPSLYAFFPTILIQISRNADLHALKSLLELFNIVFIYVDGGHYLYINELHTKTISLVLLLLMLQ